MEAKTDLPHDCIYCHNRILYGQRYVNVGGNDYAHYEHWLKDTIKRKKQPKVHR